MPGVVAIYTADDLGLAPQPPSGNVEGATGTLDKPFTREVLARDVVRFVGEPIAVVVAETLAHAVDAAENVRSSRIGTSIRSTGPMWWSAAGS